jgi:tetratricopeptide (TPR) repeat protein
MWRRSAFLAVWLAGAPVGAANPPPVPPPDLTAPAAAETLTMVMPNLPVASDRDATRRLAEAASQHAPLTAGDVEWAEALANRYSKEEALQILREAVLGEAAAQATRERRFLDALTYLRRATSLYPKHRGAYIRLLDVLLKTGDWIEAESVARQALPLDSGHADAAIGLAYALMRQDRNDDAIDVLERDPAAAGNATAQLLLARLKRIVAQEKNLAEERQVHFALRYDGQVNEAVGRRVLDVLEEHYSSLAAQLGHQPSDTVSVILLANAQYYENAPEWSGGEYDALDGRVRIPIRGLTAEKVPRLSRTLMHELTHVFVTSASGNLAPREVQEGVAQYMEGRRTADVARTTNAKYAEVVRNYGEALSFAEFLIDQGGVASLSFALRETGETGSLEKGFLAAYARDYTALRAAWKASTDADVRSPPN